MVRVEGAAPSASRSQAARSADELYPDWHEMIESDDRLLVWNQPCCHYTNLAYKEKPLWLMRVVSYDLFGMYLKNYIQLTNSKRITQQVIRIPELILLHCLHRIYLNTSFNKLKEQFW